MIRIFNEQPIVHEDVYYSNNANVDCFIRFVLVLRNKIEQCLQ